MYVNEMTEPAPVELVLAGNQRLASRLILLTVGYNRDLQCLQKSVVVYKLITFASAAVVFLVFVQIMSVVVFDWTFDY